MRNQFEGMKVKTFRNMGRDELHRIVSIPVHSPHYHIPNRKAAIRELDRRFMEGHKTKREAADKE